MHNAGLKARPTEQCRGEANAPVQVDTRMGSGSARARLIRGEWRSRPQSAHTV